MTQLELCNLALDKLGEPSISALNAPNPAAQACTRLYQPTLDTLVRKYRWNFARKSVRLKAVFVAMDDLVDSGVADLIQVEGNNHGLQTGDRVVLKDTGADGSYIITRIDSHNFTCDDSKFTSLLTVGSYHVSPPHTWEYKIALPDDCLALRTVDGYEASRPHAFFVLEGRNIFCKLEEVDVTYTQKQEGGTDEANFDTVFNNLFASMLAAELAMPITGAMSRRGDMQALYQEELNSALMSNVFEHRDNLIDRTQGPTSAMARQYA
jgi:hypothetical protein